MRPQEIAAGVYRLSIRGSNVYFVRSGSSWAMIDTAWARYERVIKDAAEALFGANSHPAAILLTHAHPITAAQHCSWRGYGAVRCTCIPTSCRWRRAR